MSDHLTPVEGYFSVANHSYHLQVRESLLANFSTTPLAGLVALPSFEPEYALWIGKDWRRHYAIYRVARRSIWQTSQIPLAEPVALTTYQVKLPTALAQAMAALFWAALGQTQYARHPALILDGTVYHATAFQTGSGLRSGKTESPPASSKLRGLLDLSEKLIQQLINHTESPQVWAELTELATALRARFGGD
jgi:hypothetical protein